MSKIYFAEGEYFCAPTYGGLYKSSDGIAWTLVAGAPTSSDDYNVTLLYVKGSLDNFWIAVSEASGSQRLYVSGHKKGKGWTFISGHAGSYSLNSESINMFTAPLDFNLVSESSTVKYPNTLLYLKQINTDRVAIITDIGVVFVVRSTSGQNPSQLYNLLNRTLAVSMSRSSVFLDSSYYYFPVLNCSTNQSLTNATYNKSYKIFNYKNLIMLTISLISDANNILFISRDYGETWYKAKVEAVDKILRIKYSCGTLVLQGLKDNNSKQLISNLDTVIECIKEESAQA